MAVDSKVSGGFFGWTRRVPREEWDSQNPDLLQEAEAYRGVEGDINYTFRDKGFLVQAFTHRTVPPNRRVVPGYMRPMDFMGDALLKDLLTTQLYGCVYPHGRGTITRARSNIECNRLFAFVVAQHGWQRLFRVGSSTLSDAIAGYVRSVIDRGQSSESAAEAPKPLADLFESLVSAVYMDSNQDIDTVWRSIYPLLRPHVQSQVATIASSGASE